MLTRARDKVGMPVLAVLVVLGLAPLVATGVTERTILVLGMVYAIGAVGLDVLIGYSGQFSFGQFVYFAVGAYVMSSIRLHENWPWPLALLIAVIAAGVVSGIVASSLVRLKFFGAAVGTFTLAAATMDLLNGPYLTRWAGGATGLSAPPVYIGHVSLGSGMGIYYASLLALTLGSVACLRYTRTRAGIAARVIKENDVVAAAMGIRVAREKVRAHVLAGAVAGLGGWLLSMYLGYLSPESFNGGQSIELFAIVVVGGLGSIAGPIVGAVFFFVAQNWLAKSGAASEILFSVLLLIVVIMFNGGLYDLGERLARKVPLRGHFARRRRELEPEGRTVTKLSEPRPHDAVQASSMDASTRDTASNRRDSEVIEGTPILKVDDVTVIFGGVKAIANVSIEVRRGEVHAVIGPNGAGKTTLLNCISGIQRISSGSVEFSGNDIARVSVSSRHQLGISRSFQHPSLIGDLNVLDNVTIGAYQNHDGTIWSELIGSPEKRRRRREARSRAVSALSTLEFPRERWSVLAGDLTMGEQKHVDIARAISADPTLLLLDEPTAGLGSDEIASVSRAIKLARDSGVTIIVIAHHVGFIRLVADQCTVLDFGQVVFSGEPEQALQDQRVIDIFVGSEVAK